jgi:hypothetical protein
MGWQVEDPASVARGRGHGGVAGAWSAQDVQGEESAGGEASVNGDPGDTEAVFGGLGDPGFYPGQQFPLGGFFPDPLVAVLLCFLAPGEEEGEEQG